MKGEREAQAEKPFATHNNICNNNSDNSIIMQ